VLARDLAGIDPASPYGTVDEDTSGAANDDMLIRHVLALKRGDARADQSVHVSVVEGPMDADACARRARGRKRHVGCGLHKSWRVVSAAVARKCAIGVVDPPLTGRRHDCDHINDRATNDDDATDDDGPTASADHSSSASAGPGPATATTG
jgi:hypothetical protein